MRFTMEGVNVFLLSSFVLHSTSCIPVSEFYPFGAAEHDRSFPKNDDGSSPRVNISTLFPFFNSQRDSLYVNTNGAISFQQTLSQFTPAPFPLNDHRSIVSPFWADVDIRNGGTVWYRETTDREILLRATNEIRLYYPSQLHFYASWIFIATWDNVAFYGASSIGRTKRNSFQAVLITNGRHSFTVFNYAEVTWTTGTASNGNANTGLGGTPAQVGFNGGDGVNFYALPESRTSAIANLASLSNVKTNGKFVFRIDTAQIEKGGCNTGGTLVVYPFHITMYGSQEITVSGPCFSANDIVQIIFPNNVSQTCVRRSEFSVACLTPTFYATGVIDIVLNVTASDGQTSRYSGFCKAMNPLFSEPGLVRVLVGEWVRGKVVTVQWTPDSLSFTASQADIQLYTIEPNDDGHPRFILEKTLSSSVIVSRGSASFVFDVETTEVILKMSEVGNNSTFQHGVWSDAFVVKPDLNTIKGQTDAKDTCERQLNADKQLPSLAEFDIQACPCRTEQIEIDLARFKLDPLCNGTLDHIDFRTSRSCQQAQARQCFRLNTPGPHGSGRLCCYDFLGNLMDAKSLSGGGTAHRFHYLGGADSVPYLSNLLYDTSPYLHCCTYIRDTAGLRLCDMFLKRRPQGDCKTYQPIRPARLSGDPHFTSLDGLSYTFNGVGEFVLLKNVNDTFSAQVRMEQVAGPDGALRKASVITSFSAKRYNMSDTVEVRLNSIRVADVLINGEILDFTNYRSQHFIGVSTTMSELNSTDGSLKQINVIFTEPRLAFRILAYPSLLNVVVVSGSDSLQGNITGLLGNFNGDPDDDLTTDDGHKISPNSTARIIHQMFGLTWRVKKRDSLFTYPIGKNYSTFQNEAFTPIFPEPSQTFTPEAWTICGDDEFCLYDYHTTGRADIAGATRAATQTFKNIQLQAEPAIVCSHPIDVAYGYWNSTGLTVNSTAVLQCEFGRRPSRSDVISCTADGTWENSTDACIEIRCGTLPVIPSGRWMASTFAVGTKATLHCDVGSNLNGSGIMTCDNIGRWNPYGQTCVKVDCGPPPALSRGHWVTNGTTFGHSALLECDEGSETVVDCGHLPTIAHGHWNVTMTTFGHTAELVCEEGRQSANVSNVTCGLSGKWNISSLACDLVICGPPHPAHNGMWTGGEYTYGSLLHLRCNVGSNLIGNDTVSCGADGQWLSTGQKCDEIDCGILPHVSYGQWKSNGTTFGHTAFLLCDEGRQPSSPGNATCGVKETWNVNNHTCQRVRCILPTAAKDGYVGTGDASNCTIENIDTSVITYCYYGTLVQLGCPEGETPSGNTTTTALCMADGKWSHTHLECHSNPASSDSTKKTIGGTVGGLSSTITAIIVFIIILRRRRKRSFNITTSAPDMESREHIKTTTM
ncbi:protein mesh-like isoform X2 [Argopecten irradians]|uniref:protein mesh-like isoform X2 n=1 Tax=Argopecten irradians TaxID=31199 RepID=UPI003723BF7C